MKSFYTVTLLTFLFSSSLNAQPGSPDVQFGQGGKEYFSDMHTHAKSVIIQSNGKILVGGSHSDFEIDDLGIVIARFETNGSKDFGFGNEGEVIITSAGFSKGVSVVSLAQQTDGKILACARFITQAGDVGVIRLNEDGSLDNTFGANGIVVLSIGTEDMLGGMALQTDGKIVLAGKKGVGFSSTGSDFVLRLLPNGSKDNSFGNMGVVLTDYISTATLGAVTLQTDGKILTSGIYGQLTKQIQVTRYNVNGTIDSTFGVNGLARLVPAEQDRYALKVTDMNTQPDGKILVAGSAASYRMCVSRFLDNGQPDLTFVTDKGYAILPMSAGYAEARSVFFNAERVIITGRYTLTEFSVAAVAFKDNGALDSSFGENGIAQSSIDTLPNGTTPESGEGAIQVDGKIVIAGSFLENEDNFYNLALFRLNGYQQEKYVRIKKWLHRHGFTWEDWPGKNINYYSVQRSTTGNNFGEIARLFNRSNQQQFSYTDAAPLTGNNYYRLAAVSADGAVAYSNILAIPNNTAIIKIYPNPAKNNLFIEGLSANTKTKLVVTDINGVARMTTVVNSNTYNWNISNLKQGNYVLQVVVSGNIIATKKFIKE